MRSMVVLAGALVLVGACSSGDAEVEEPETSSVEDRDPQFAADLEAAERSLLTIDDFPSRWEELPAVDDARDPASEERIATCAGYEVGELYPGDSVPTAQSPTFQSSDDEEVFATVRVTSSEKDAADALDRLDHETTLQCIADEVRTLVETADSSADHVTMTDVRVDRTAVPLIGDESVAVQVVVSLQTDGAPVELFLDVVTLRVGRGVAQLRGFSALDPLDLGEIEGYGRTVAERMATEIP